MYVNITQLFPHKPVIFVLLTAFPATFSKPSKHDYSLARLADLT
jgi:hypothetical protein